MAASPSASVYRRLRNIRPNIDVVVRFSVDGVSVQRSQNAVDWKGTSESYGACTTAGAIKCVDVVIISTCILTFLSDLWYKASQIHRSGSRRQELSGTFILGITSAHALSSPQAIDKGKTCGPCTHRYSASNRRCQLDSLRDNEGDVHSHNRQG